MHFKSHITMEYVWPQILSSARSGMPSKCPKCVTLSILTRSALISTMMNKTTSSSFQGADTFLRFQMKILES